MVPLKKLIGKIKKSLGLDVVGRRLRKLEQSNEALQIILGKVLSEMNKPNSDFNSSHFKIFSQFGDDGLIQYLCDRIEIRKKIFVEFGVENYRESNTRFLLFNNNWKGLVMDGDPDNINQIIKSEYYWKFDLTAKAEFVTKNNINQLLLENGFQGEIGLLHIDIDGNDYWIWRELSVVDPDIVIIEYNANFGIERSITIPYQEDFQRTKAHFSNLYWGSSIRALYNLADEKGYAFIGCNDGGNNAYFVKREKIGDLKIKTIKEGYREPKYRESLDKNGNFNFLNIEQRKETIKGLEVFNTIKNCLEKL